MGRFGSVGVAGPPTTTKVSSHAESDSPAALRIISSNTLALTFELNRGRKTCGAGEPNVNAGVGVGSLAREGVLGAKLSSFRPVKLSLLSAFFRFPTSPFPTSAALSMSSFFSSPSLSVAIVCLATFEEASPNFAGVPSTRSKVVLKAGKLGVPPTLGRGAATRRTVSTLGGGVKGVISGGGGDGSSGTLAA